MKYIMQCILSRQRGDFKDKKEGNPIWVTLFLLSIGKKTTRLSPLPRMLSKVSPERLKGPAGSLRTPL